MGEKKVTVGFIVQGKNGKLLQGSTALRDNRLGLGALFCKDPCNVGTAKFKLCFYPHQTLRPGNEGAVQGHVDVPYVDVL